MIRYTYLKDVRDFVLKFDSSKIDVITTKEIYVPSGFGIYNTNIGIHPNEGVVLIPCTPFGNGYTVINVPIVEKCDLIIYVYNIPEMIMGYRRKGDVIASLIPVTTGYMSNIEKYYVDPVAW